MPILYVFPHPDDESFGPTPAEPDRQNEKTPLTRR